MPSRNSKLHLAAWLSALFLVVLGAKLWVIQVYGSALPYWDQWDEAGHFFQPWLEGHLAWGAWFAPHNEHRIFFTRLLDWAVLRLNHQWDPLLQMTINAFIHAGYACGLAWGLWRFSGREHAARICLLLMPFFALPFAAENTLHGFQSQMYFLSIFSVITLIGLGFGSPGSSRWLAGLAAAVMSLFTMGSGLLASLAVIGLVMLRMLRQRGVTQKNLITLGAGLAVFTLGVALQLSAGHGPFRARSTLALLESLAGNLAWPFGDEPVMLCLIGLPLFITLAKYFRGDFKDPRAAEFVLALGFWGFLQAMALAYGRTHLGGSSRYLDTLSTIPLASMASLFVLGQGPDFRRFPPRLVTLLAVVWVATLFWGLWRISRTAMEDYKFLGNYLQWAKRWNLVEEENVRAFVATNDRRYLPDRPLWSIPYQDANRLAELLQNPQLSAILPPICRPLLPLEKDGPADAAFVPDGCPPDVPQQKFTRIWGNYPTNGAGTNGSFVSQPLSAGLPVLMIPVACGTNLEGIRLRLIETETGHSIELRPQAVRRWQVLMVAAPANPFRLEITDQNPNSWVAVGDLNEMGRLAYDARRLLEHAAGVLLAGLGLCVMLSGWDGFRRRMLPDQEVLVALLLWLVVMVALARVWSARNYDPARLACKLHKELAGEFASAKDWPEAEIHLRAALWLQPDDPETFCNLADAILHDPGLEKKQAGEQAILDYRAALRWKPDYPDARKRLNQTLLELGRQNAADH